METTNFISPRIRAKEACQILGCSKNLLYSLDKRGELKLYRNGTRFTYWLRDEVEKFARGQNPYAGEDCNV